MKKIYLLVVWLCCVMTAPLARGAEKDFVSKFTVPAEEWTSSYSNAWFVLEPGYLLMLEGKEGGKGTRLTITVLDETVKVDGVETRVVEERETKGGELIEISRNFFAASKKTGDVYYFGEDVDFYKDGKVTGHGGSWRAGVNGAAFGLMMPGKPLVGQRYYQEVAGDVARDRAEIVSVSETIETPAGKFTGCLKTEETTPLEPDAKDYKLYAPGVGLVRDGDIVLIQYGKLKR